MEDIIIPPGEPLRVPKGYVSSKENPRILKWKYPPCMYRKQEERSCCGGRVTKIEYCWRLKVQVIRECAECLARKEE